MTPESSAGSTTVHTRTLVLVRSVPIIMYVISQPKSKEEIEDKKHPFRKKTN